MTDHSQQTIVITGASAGIGAAAAGELARRGARVVMVGRTPAKLEAAADRVRAATGQNPGRHVADFASFADVRRLAAELLAAYERIDVLANNAGLIVAKKQPTVDGNELTIQANHLSPFLLTNLLLDRLSAAPAGRIITTASAAESTGELDPGDLDFSRRRWTRWRAYCSSKQANILFTTELARRLAGGTVSATCFHPGLVRSDFGQTSPLFRIGKLVAPFAFVSPEQGADTLLWLATGETGGAMPGGYFANRGIARPRPKSQDHALAARLWDVSETLVALRPRQPLG